MEQSREYYWGPLSYLFNKDWWWWWRRSHAAPFYWCWNHYKAYLSLSEHKISDMLCLYMAITANGPHSLHLFVIISLFSLWKKAYATKIVTYPTESIGAGYANVLWMQKKATWLREIIYKQVGHWIKLTLFLQIIH